MSTNRKRIQAYVNLSTYEMLSDQANSEGISVSEAVSQILQTYLLSDSRVQSHTSPSSNLVTVEALAALLEDFQKEVDSTIIREISIAETRWSTRAEAITDLQTLMVEKLNKEPDKRSKSRRQRRKSGFQQ